MLGTSLTQVLSISIVFLVQRRKLYDELGGPAMMHSSKSCEYSIRCEIIFGVLQGKRNSSYVSEHLLLLLLLLLQQQQQQQQQRRRRRHSVYSYTLISNLMPATNILRPQTVLLIQIYFSVKGFFLEQCCSVSVNMVLLSSW